MRRHFNFQGTASISLSLCHCVVGNDCDLSSVMSRKVEEASINELGGSCQRRLELIVYRILDVVNNRGQYAGSQSTWRMLQESLKGDEGLTIGTSRGAKTIRMHAAPSSSRSCQALDTEIRILFLDAI
ncbi:hypothetical protein F4803DRAFT_192210 [Xylaria telfairii]|nr:hypothetical protein F4803DRAFT_192210 [Xylaria telfairii]